MTKMSKEIESLEKDDKGFKVGDIVGTARDMGVSISNITYEKAIDLIRSGDGGDLWISVPVERLSAQEFLDLTFGTHRYIRIRN